MHSPETGQVTSKPGPEPFKTGLTNSVDSIDNADLNDASHQRFWQNWFVNIAFLVLAMLGLNLEVFGILRGRTMIPWPWKGTEFVLVVGFSVIVALYGVYVTLRQRQLWDHLNKSRVEAMQQVERHYNRLVGINSMNMILASKTTPQEVFDSLTQVCAETFPCDQVSLMLRRPNSEELEVRSAIGHADLSLVREARVKIGEGIAGRVAEQQKPLILGPNVDTSQFKDFRRKSEPLNSAMIVPILVRDELMGVLNVSNRDTRTIYTEEDLKALLVFSWSAAICIRHAEQAEWLRQTIRDLQDALEVRESSKTRAA